MNVEATTRPLLALAANVKNVFFFKQIFSGAPKDCRSLKALTDTKTLWHSQAQFFVLFFFFFFFLFFLFRFSRSSCVMPPPCAATRVKGGGWYLITQLPLRPCGQLGLMAFRAEANNLHRVNSLCSTCALEVSDTKPAVLSLDSLYVIYNSLSLSACLSVCLSLSLCHIYNYLCYI